MRSAAGAPAAGGTGGLGAEGPEVSHWVGRSIVSTRDFTMGIPHIPTVRLTRSWCWQRGGMDTRSFAHAGGGNRTFGFSCAAGVYDAYNCLTETRADWCGVEQ